MVCWELEDMLYQITLLILHQRWEPRFYGASSFLDALPWKPSQGLPLKLFCFKQMVDPERKKKKETLYSDCCGSKGCVSINIAGPWSKWFNDFIYGRTPRQERFRDPHLKISHSLWQNVLMDNVNSSKDEELKNYSPNTTVGYHTGIIEENKDASTLKNLLFFPIFCGRTLSGGSKTCHGEGL